MSQSISTGFRSGALACALAGLLFAFGPLAEIAAAAPEISQEGQALASWFERMEAHFEAHPELKDRPGSGWKPYNRYKWFTQQRMLNGEPPRPGARWEAWEYKRQLEQQEPSPRNTWFSLGPTNLAGRMLAVDFHPANPSIVYVGAADGGVWKTTNNGASWTPMSDELPSLAVGGLAVSKTDPNIIVIGTGEAGYNIDAVRGVGILRSTDGGITWETTSLSYSVGGSHGFHFVECAPSGIFLAGATDGLWRSVNDGATWFHKKVGGDYYDAVWSPVDSATVFTVKGNTSSGGGIKVSTNDGQGWATAGTGQPFGFSFGKTKLGISGTTIYAFIGDPGINVDGTSLIKSTDNGVTWNSVAASNLPSGQSSYNLVCTADPNNADRVIVGAVGMARSGNGGLSFNSVLGGVHVDQHCIKYEPGSNTRLWVGNDGGMYRNLSDGALASWINMNNGLVTFQFYDICVNNGSVAPYYVLGGTQDNGTDRWSGTTTWNEVIGGDGMVCNIGAVTGTIAYGEIQFGNHRKSTSSGTGFFGFNTGLTGTGDWVAPVALDPNDEEHLLTETTDGIFRSTNGSSWEWVSDYNPLWLDISPVDGDVAWGISARVYLTTDNGDTWSQVPTFGFQVGGATKILANLTDVNSAFATFSGYSDVVAHVALTTDLGQTWTDVTGDFPGLPVNAIAVDPSFPNDWYIGTDVGCWYSGDGGAHWSPYETGLPNAVVVDLEIADAQRKLVAGTHGRGGWEVALRPSGVDAPEVSVAPEALNLMLDEPWPNPVRDRTLLRYAAKSDAKVTLAVYDVQGRLVSDLEDFSRGDGVIRTTPWLTDDVPAGVYFAVLRAGAVQKSQKITVIK